jgi:hypothetical protein
MMLQYFDKAYQAANAEGYSTFISVHEMCHLSSKSPCEVSQCNRRTTLWANTYAAEHLVIVGILGVRL